MEGVTFSLVDRPKHGNVVKCKWVLKVKRKHDGQIERYKARLVACGYSQQHGSDYPEVWSPTGHHASLKTLVVHVVQYDLEIRHVDIKCAFLNGGVEETMYMKQPPMFGDGTNRV